jgi:hypothetical protein
MSLSLPAVAAASPIAAVAQRGPKAASADAISLMHLSGDILSIIIRYIPSSSIVNLRQVCNHFYYSLGDIPVSSRHHLSLMPSIPLRPSMTVHEIFQQASRLYQQLPEEVKPLFKAQFLSCLPHQLAQAALTQVITR